KSGKATLAFPIHTARSSRLGCDGATRPRRCRFPGAAAEIASAGESKWILLCSRSNERAIPAGETIRQKAELGERRGTGRTPSSARGKSDHQGRGEDLSSRSRSNELVFHFISSGHKIVLCHGG